MKKCSCPNCRLGRKFYKVTFKDGDEPMEVSYTHMSHIDKDIIENTSEVKE